jgi:hypothetical protein
VRAAPCRTAGATVLALTGVAATAMRLRTAQELDCRRCACLANFADIRAYLHPLVVMRTLSAASFLPDGAPPARTAVRRKAQ